MKRGLAIGIIVAVAVVVGVGAFFGGKAAGGGGTPTAQQAIKALQNMTAEERAQVFQNGAGNGAFGGGTRGANGGTGGFTTGTIVSGDSSSITVKLIGGGTKLVLFSPSTVIAVSKTGSASDLTTGQEVSVTGAANTDGSVTATREESSSARCARASHGGMLPAVGSPRTWAIACCSRAEPRLARRACSGVRFLPWRFRKLL